MGVLANHGVLFAGYTYLPVDAEDSVVEVDNSTPEPGSSVGVSITAGTGEIPAPNRGVRITVSPADDLTIPDVPRTDADGEVAVDIAIGAEAEAVERTITVSCGGVTLADQPTFTPTAA